MVERGFEIRHVLGDRNPMLHWICKAICLSHGWPLALTCCCCPFGNFVPQKSEKDAGREGARAAEMAATMQWKVRLGNCRRIGNVQQAQLFPVSCNVQPTVIACCSCRSLVRCECFPPLYYALHASFLWFEVHENYYSTPSVCACRILLRERMKSTRPFLF